MNALGLDLGSKTGYAILQDEKIECGTKKLRTSTPGSRFCDFYCWMTGLISTINPQIIFFERVYSHNGTEAAHVYGAFMYILISMCEVRGIRCVGLSVCAIKKHLSGSGRASKSDMIAAARALGYAPVDDNAADAIGVLLCGLNTTKQLIIKPEHTEAQSMADEWPTWRYRG